MMTGNTEMNSATTKQESENGPREIAIEFADEGEDAFSEEEASPPESSENEESAQQVAQAAQESEAMESSAQENALTNDDPPAEKGDHSSNGESLAVEDHGGLAIADFQSQIDALVRDKNLLYDQLLRRQAEFENYRKRTERDKADTYNRARADIMLDLLPVIDNFDRAVSSLETSNEDAAGLRHGIELIHKQFKDILTKLGLEPVEAVGRAFDPHVHEAVATESTDEHEENMIIAEFERGYKLGDKLLRPAKVKVASPSED